MLGFAPLSSTPLADSGKVVYLLNADGVVTGAPKLGQPVLLEGFGAIGVTTGVPVLGKPAIEQEHVLNADDLISGNPELGQAIFVDLLSPTNITTNPPKLGKPNLSIVVDLLADGITTGSPKVPNLFLVEGTQFTVLVTGTFTDVIQVNGTFIGDREINTTWRRVDVH